MKFFQALLTVVLSSAIVVSTCGMLEFFMYILTIPEFRREYWPYLAVFSVGNICAIILLAGVLHKVTATAAAIGLGALAHLLLYVIHWKIGASTLAAIAGDAIIVLIAMTVAYSYAQRSREATAMARTSFWSSLDPASKVSIITSVITAIGGIVTAIIGLLPKLG